MACAEPTACRQSPFPKHENQEHTVADRPHRGMAAHQAGGVPDRAGYGPVEVNLLMSVIQPETFP
jgi:hypothetical protein